MILVFDTETSGLYRQELPAAHPAQPHLVQLGLVLMEDNGIERAVVDLMVRPEGYAIPDSAAAIHGITTDIAAAAGVPLVVAVSIAIT